MWGRVKTSIEDTVAIEVSSILIPEEGCGQRNWGIKVSSNQILGEGHGWGSGDG